MTTSAVGWNKRSLQLAVQRRAQLMKSRAKKPKKPAKWEHPKNWERTYIWRLQSMVKKARAYAAAAMPAMVTHITAVQASHPVKPRQDDVADDDFQLTLRSLEQKIIEVFDDDDSQELASQVIAGVNQFNREQFDKVVKSVLNVNIFAREPWLSNAMGIATKNNVALIQDVGRQITKDINQSVTNALLGGINVRDFTDSILSDLDGKRGVFNKAETRARLIARDQVGKWNGALTKLRQTNVGGEEYIWRTSEDERVRPTHAEHDGKTFRWDDPPAETGAPGEDYQCRCYAEMKFKGVLADEPDEDGSEGDE